MRVLLFIVTIICLGNCYATGGFYAGIGAGYSSIINIPQSGLSFANGSTGSQETPAFTTALYGGYNFNQIVGVQVDYNIAFNGQVSGYSINQQLFDAAVLLHLPFGIFTDTLKGFSLYAKGGIGYSNYDFDGQLITCTTCINLPSSTYAFIPVYGLGAEYSFSSLGIRAEWDYSGNVIAPNFGSNQVQLNSNMYLLSILYHF